MGVLFANGKLASIVSGCFQVFAKALLCGY